MGAGNRAVLRGVGSSAEVQVSRHQVPAAAPAHRYQLRLMWLIVVIATCISGYCFGR
jgi:hypothetical protein